MKQFISILSLSILFLVNCKYEPVPPLNDKLITETIAPGIVPSGVGLNDLVLNPDDHNWKDLDAFYKNIVPEHIGKSYHGNLKKMVIVHLVNQFDLLEHAEIETIEYYVNEQRRLNLIDPNVFMKSISKMKGKWTNEQIREIAADEYERSMMFIKKEFSENDEFLKKSADKFKTLKSFSEKFPSRWGY